MANKSKSLLKDQMVYCRELILICNIGELDSFLSFHISWNLFDEMKQQKIFVNIAPEYRKSVCSVVLQCLLRFHHQDRRMQETILYFDFIELVIPARDMIRSQCERHLENIPKMDFSSLMRIMQKHFDDYSRTSLNELLEETARNTVLNYEKQLHDRSGSNTDFLFAIFRAMNEISRFKIGDVRVSPTRAW